MQTPDAGKTSIEDAFAELYRRYGATVEGLLAVEVGTEAAASLFRDVWTVFYQRWRQWRLGDGEGEEAGAGGRPVLRYLYGTCQCVLQAYRRRAAARDDDDELAPGACLDLTRASSEELGVLGGHLAGLSDEEMARVLNVTAAEVGQRRERLLGRLGQGDDEGVEAEAELRQRWQALVARLAKGGAAARPLAPEAFEIGQATVLFAEIEDLRGIWHQLRATGALETHADRFVSTGTVKELVAHVASWVKEYRQEAEIAGRGEAFDYTIPFGLSPAGPRAWNDAEIEVRQSMSLAELGDEIETETARLQDLVLALPDEALCRQQYFPLARTADPATVWEADVARLVNHQMYSHVLYHLKQLHEVAAQAGAVA